MEKVVQLEWADILMMEGIYAKGYGILPRYPMIDSEISITAKAIYAYLCSLSGNGVTVYPSVATIKGHLGIGRRAYTTHFEQLLEAGYVIKTTQRDSGNRFAHNLYTLASNPKKFTLPQPTKGKSRIASRICADGLKSVGYGMIPRTVMIDSRLDAKAKAIYAYFASFTGSGNVAFPSISQITRQLAINKDTYHKYMRELTKLNYITVVQGHNGLLTHNQYFLNDNPDERLAQTGPTVAKIIPDILNDDEEIPEKKHKGKSVAGYQQPKNVHTGNKQQPKNVHMENNQRPKNVHSEKTCNINAFQDFGQNQDQQERYQQPKNVYTENVQPVKECPEDVHPVKEHSNINTLNNNTPNYYQYISSSLEKETMMTPAEKRDSLINDLMESFVYDFCDENNKPIFSTENLEMKKEIIDHVVTFLLSDRTKINIMNEVVSKQDFGNKIMEIDKADFSALADRLSATMYNVKNREIYILSSLYNLGCETAYLNSKESFSGA